MHCTATSTSTHTESEPIEALRQECREWCILWKPEESFCLGSALLPPATARTPFVEIPDIVNLPVTRTADHTRVASCEVVKCWRMCHRMVEYVRFITYPQDSCSSVILWARMSSSMINI